MSLSSTKPNKQSSESPQRWAYEPQNPKPISLGRWISYVGLGLLIAVIITVGVGFVAGVVTFYQADMIIPGVYVNQIEVGGLSKSEATVLLQEQWQDQQIHLRSPQVEPVVTVQELGFTLEVSPTVELAHQQGRSWASVQSLIQTGGKAYLTSTWQFSPAVAHQTVSELAPLFEKPAVEADIRLVEGQAEAIPAVEGQRLDISATVAQLSQNPTEILDQGELSLILQKIKPEVTDVTIPVAEANQLLSHTLTIQAYDPIVDETLLLEIEPKIWQNWLSLSLKKEGDNQIQLDWSIDEAQLRDYLETQELGKGRYLKLDEVIPALLTAMREGSWAVEFRIFYGERQHTVQSGETLSSIGYDYGIPYPWLEEANPEVVELTPGQVITIPSPDLLLPLPIVKGKRITISLSEQKMWAYEGDSVKWEWSVSTGIASSPTAPGVFQVQSHELDAYAASWNLWMPHFMGIYRPVPYSHFMNGFHGFPTRGGSTLLWTNDLGHPVTYGCILISSENAERLYTWAEEGVIVEIKK